MAIALRSSAEARNLATTTHTVTTPSGAASGDVLYGVWYCIASGAWAVPAGWTSLINTADATYGSMLVCRLVLAGAPDGSYAATTTGNETSWGIITAWTGVDTTTPEDVAAAYLQNASGTYTTPSITTATADAVLMCHWSQGLPVTITVDGATTLIDTGASGPSYGASYQTIASPGATGTRTATGMTTHNTCASVGIRPAAAVQQSTPNAAMLMGIGI